MKYIVGLKYTNPSHEHVSLRRRVESRNTIIEAASEEEAILRASRQQRALGFLIKEAVIVKPELNEQVEQLDELHQGKEYTKKELVDKMKAGNWETSYDIKPGKHVEMKHRSGKKVSVYVKEEVEQVDEAKGEPPAEFMPSDTKLPRIKVPAKPKPGVRKRGPVGSFNKKGVWNPGVREDADPDKREAGYKMRPSVRAAQKASDKLSKATKKIQAGTLAAKKAREKAKGSMNGVDVEPKAEMKGGESN